MSADNRHVIAVGEEFPCTVQNTVHIQDTPTDMEPVNAVPSPKRNGSERFAILNRFVDSNMTDLTGADIKTWICLYRDVRNGVAETSVSYIAKRAGLSERIIKKSLKRLKDKGFVEVLRRGAPGIGSSRYRIA